MGQGFVLTGVDTYSEYGIAFFAQTASASTVILNIKEYLIHRDGIIFPMKLRLRKVYDLLKVVHSECLRTLIEC